MTKIKIPIYRRKTLVKVKIVHRVEASGSQSLVVWFWKPWFWVFGSWYPFGVSHGGNQMEKVEKINDTSVSELLYNEFIAPSDDIDVIDLVKIHDRVEYDLNPVENYLIDKLGFTLKDIVLNREMCKAEAEYWRTKTNTKANNLIFNIDHNEDIDYILMELRNRGFSYSGSIPDWEYTYLAIKKLHLSTNAKVVIYVNMNNKNMEIVEIPPYAEPHDRTKSYNELIALLDTIPVNKV